MDSESGDPNARRSIFGNFLVAEVRRAISCISVSRQFVSFYLLRYWKTSGTRKAGLVIKSDLPGPKNF